MNLKKTFSEKITNLKKFLKREKEFKSINDALEAYNTGEDITYKSVPYNYGSFLQELDNRTAPYKTINDALKAYNKGISISENSLPEDLYKQFLNTLDDKTARYQTVEEAIIAYNKGATVDEKCFGSQYKYYNFLVELNIKTKPKEVEITLER